MPLIADITRLSTSTHLGIQPNLERILLHFIIDKLAEPLFKLLMKPRIRTYLIINIIIPLTIGIMIYLLSRNEIVYSWLEYSGIHLYMDINKLPNLMYLPDWIKFFVPDALWSYAFTSMIILLWLRKLNYFWLTTPLLTGLVLEILQFYNITSGTFDIIDLLCILLGYLLAFIFGLRWLRKWEES